MTGILKPSVYCTVLQYSLLSSKLPVFDVNNKIRVAFSSLKFPTDENAWVLCLPFCDRRGKLKDPSALKGLASCIFH